MHHSSELLTSALVVQEHARGAVGRGPRTPHKAKVRGSSRVGTRTGPGTGIGTSTGTGTSAGTGTCIGTSTRTRTSTSTSTRTNSPAVSLRPLVASNVVGLLHGCPLGALASLVASML